MLAWMLHNTLWAAALAVLVLGLARLTRPGPAALHALWLVVLLKLIAPPGLEWPLPVPESTSRAAVMPAGVPFATPPAPAELARPEPAGEPVLEELFVVVAPAA